jgi:lipoprotein-anchoring transpeptidase ErfK/SrfK
MAATKRTLRYALTAAVVLAALTLAPAGAAKVKLPAYFPAAGDLLKLEVIVHARPDSHSKVVRKMKQFRPDYHFQEILALKAQRGPDGLMWYELSLPGRPNGGRGWVRADQVEIAAVKNRIVVYRGARRIEVRRVTDDKVLLSAKVAVGMPGAETPLGRNYYVQSRFVPDNSFLGTFALETSAYSKLTDWPGGGVVGIHGTSLPQLLGQAVSHGCIRVHNETANALRRLAPVGTPIDIVA